jgi:hypothetical protein
MGVINPQDSQNRSNNLDVTAFFPDISQKIQISPSFFSRIKGMVFNTQKNDEEIRTRAKLVEKMNELQNTADDVFNQLFSIREDLEKMQFDQRLFNSITSVIDPLIKDMGRLRHAKDSDKHDTEVVDKYQQWINLKVKPWVKLLANQAHDRNAVIHAVVRFTIHASNELIDRDLKVINEYLKHKIIDLRLTSEVHQKLQNVLVEPLHRLAALRSAPQDLSLEELNAWKIKVDKEREESSNDALDAIDQVIEQISVDAANENGEVLVENFDEIIDLEESVPQLLKEISRFHENEQPSVEDQEILQGFKERLIFLEAEASRLEAHLELTPELQDRLDVMKFELSLARQKL